MTDTVKPISDDEITELETLVLNGPYATKDIPVNNVMRSLVARIRAQDAEIERLQVALDPASSFLETLADTKTVTSSRLVDYCREFARNGRAALDERSVGLRPKGPAAPAALERPLK